MCALLTFENVCLESQVFSFSRQPATTGSSTLSWQGPRYGRATGRSQPRLPWRLPIAIKTWLIQTRGSFAKVFFFFKPKINPIYFKSILGEYGPTKGCTNGDESPGLPVLTIDLSIARGRGGADIGWWGEKKKDRRLCKETWVGGEKTASFESFTSRHPMHVLLLLLLLHLIESKLFFWLFSPRIAFPLDFCQTFNQTGRWH